MRYCQPVLLHSNFEHAFVYQWRVVHVVDSLIHDLHTGPFDTSYDSTCWDRYVPTHGKGLYLMERLSSVDSTFLVRLVRVRLSYVMSSTIPP